MSEMMYMYSTVGRGCGGLAISVLNSGLRGLGLLLVLRNIVL